MTSPEHTVREALRDITALPKESRWHSLTNDDPVAALDELVAERDEARKAFRIGHDTLMKMQARAEVAEAERDRLREALRPFVEDYDFHAADYLADRVDGEETRVFTARTVDSLIEHQRIARAAHRGKDPPRNVRWGNG